ncbi:MAG: DUF4835 family protein [Bacteroidales bacterium]|nr:DUF4835 family protein [Bacteroidales bacterium]
MRLLNRTLFLLFFLLSYFAMEAQELNCRVQINSDQIQGTNKQVFTSLQTALTEFLNNRKWTNAQFSPVEKLDCSFVITIKEESGNNRYKAELQVQSRRPIYNSIYSSTLLNFRDVSFDFNYVEFDPLQLSDNKFEGNLTAVVAFYVNIILGMDFDSFSPMGGTAFYTRAEQIMNLAQSNMETGWQAFDSPKNRPAIVAAFLDDGIKDYRLMLYQYHRLGLDQMSINPDKGRSVIAESLGILKTVYDARPTTVLLTIFSDAKLDELNDVFSKGTPTEKEAVYKILSDVFPAQTGRYESIRR